jgi:transcription initiation factor TFIIB
MSLRTVYGRTFDEDIVLDVQSDVTCPECSGTVQTSSIETACEDCGLIFEDRPIDHGPEWRAFDEIERKERKRTGPPLTPIRHDRGLSSEIGFDHTDANGVHFSGRKRRQLARLRREHNRGRWPSKAKRNLAHGLSEVRRIVGALDLPRNLRDFACRLYRTAAGEDLIRGRSIEAMAAASVFAACRCEGLPRMLDEVGTVAAVSKDRVNNAYSVLNRELDLAAVPMDPVQYISRFVSDLDLSCETRRHALALAREATDMGIVNGCRPTGVAAACVYEAAREGDEDITQVALAELADISTGTLRMQWKKLRA